jgi:hypothetical protein
MRAAKTDRHADISIDGPGTGDGMAKRGARGARGRRIRTAVLFFGMSPLNGMTAALSPMSGQVEGSPIPRGLLSVHLRACNDAMCSSEKSPCREAWELCVAIAVRRLDAHGALCSICSLLQPHIPHLVELMRYLAARAVPAHEILRGVMLRRSTVDFSQYMVPRRSSAVAVRDTSSDWMETARTERARGRPHRPRASAPRARPVESDPPCVFWHTFEV